VAPVRIRPARAGDHAAYARLHPELVVPHPPVPAQIWVATRLPTTVIAERDGAVVGYAYYELLGRLGHVRNLVVAPEARSAGIGRLLMDEVARRLRAARASAWALNVKPDNLAAIRLYERCGMQPGHGSVVLRLPWSLVEQLPPNPAVSAAPIEPADDAAIEATTGMVPGELAAARGKRDRVLVQLREREAFAGAAVFVPAIPGSHPFRPARPALAGDLLRALRTHAAAADDFINVVVEDDDALGTALLAAGALEIMRVLHFRGPL
jgi:GNAT superfamily N-acetyltransferase